MNNLNDISYELYYHIKDEFNKKNSKNFFDNIDEESD